MIWRYQAWAASRTHFSWLYMRVCCHSAQSDSPANARTVVGQCCNSICRIRKSHIKVYIFFQHNKKHIKEQLGHMYFFFLNAAVLSRNILLKAKYRIRTLYRHLLNIKRTWIRIGVKKKKKKEVVVAGK